jgi:hypothetical protein
MDSLYRFEARFTALVPIGVVPDGLRLDAHFEGRVVEGRLAGATVTGVDYLRFRSDGVGVMDVRVVLARDGDRVEVEVGGYVVPPAGVALPPPEVMLAPEFAWPEVELPLYGFATYRTAMDWWQELNSTVGLINGVANPGAGTLVIEAERLVPTGGTARIAA